MISWRRRWKSGFVCDSRLRNRKSERDDGSNAIYNISRKIHANWTIDAFKSTIMLGALEQLSNFTSICEFTTCQIGTPFLHFEVSFSLLIF